jgi:hypothetical protein
MPSKLDSLKPVIDQWLAAQPRLLATRVHQDLRQDVPGIVRFAIAMTCSAGSWAAIATSPSEQPLMKRLPEHCQWPSTSTKPICDLVSASGS